MIQHRRAQLMQSREGELHFRLHARCPRYPAPRSPPGQVVQQRGLAHPRLTAHHQGPASTGPHISNEPVKYATFPGPAGQPCCRPPDTRMCRHRPSVAQRPWRRHCLLWQGGAGTRAESERVLARLGPQTKASASDYTGATRPPEHDAETSGTTPLRRANQLRGAFPGLWADGGRDELRQSGRRAWGRGGRCSRWFWRLCRGVRVPGPVLEIVAGIVLGPAVLDLVQPDQAVRLISTIGLAFLLFLAGLEIDVRHFRGPRARLAGLALGLSALLALITGTVLHATGVAGSPLLIGIILLATSLGLIVPILDDAGVTGRPASTSSPSPAPHSANSPQSFCCPYSSPATPPASAISKLLLLSLLGVLVGPHRHRSRCRAERSLWITTMISKLADLPQPKSDTAVDTARGPAWAPWPIRPARIRGHPRRLHPPGAILRLVDADHTHPLFHPKLDAIGYGFLIPASSSSPADSPLNLSVLFSAPATLLRVPLFLLALLVVRGLPAILYRSALPSIRDAAAVGLLQATSLPFIVAAATIGLRLHAIRPANAAALVAAGLLSVIIFPTTALQLLRSSAKDPTVAPEHAHVR